MAGRRNLSQQANSVEQQRTFRAMYPEELRAGRDIFGNFFPEAAENIVKLARGGITYTKMNKKGEEVTLTTPPDLAANIYIIDRFLGTPRPEPDHILDRLNTARAVFMERQVVEGLIEAQVKEITSRAELRLVEKDLWPKQFVTEEEQQDQLQAVASALLRKLMALTPEEYAEINEKHGDPSAALEALKGKIGVELSEVMEEVMSKEGEDDKDDEEEED